MRKQMIFLKKIKFMKDIFAYLDIGPNLSYGIYSILPTPSHNNHFVQWKTKFIVAAAE